MMDWDKVGGQWKKFRGKVKEQWGLLTDDDATAIAGRRDQLAGKLQERYGTSRAAAEREIDDWLAQQSVPGGEDRTAASVPRAVAGVRALRDRLAAENPSFAAAVEATSRADAFCQSVRQDLRALRKQRGLNQAELGEIMDRTQSAVSKIETGQGDLGLQAVYRYAEAMGCHPVMVFMPSADAMAKQSEGEPAEAALRLENAQTALLRSMSGNIADMAVDLMKKG